MLKMHPLHGTSALSKLMVVREPPRQTEKVAQMEEISLSNLFIEMTLTCSLDKKKGPRKREIKKFKV